MNEANEKEETCTLFVRPFPTELRKELRIYCAQKGVTMHSQITDVLKKFMDKHHRREGEDKQ